jgi:excisionase family DNA binding protein
MDAQLILTPVPLADLMAQIRATVRDELKQQQVADLAEKLMTAKEAADLLRVSLVTLWQWEKQGRIIKHSMGGRTYFKYSELMASLKTLQRYRKPIMVKRGAAL